MKKYLFILSVATLGFASCSNDDVIAENTTLAPQPKEIAFSPLSQTHTRAAIEGTAFPTTLDMQVVAYDVTNTRNFFSSTTFKYNYENSSLGTSGYWGGNPAKYWPLSAAYINFLAIANESGTVTWDPEQETVADKVYAKQVNVATADNYISSATQKDLVYAIGNGEVTKSINALVFPDNVPMTFKHAQAYMTFRVKAADDPSTAIKIKNIEIDNSSCQGTAQIIFENYNANSEQSVSLFWPDANKTIESNYRSVLSDRAAYADEAASYPLTTNFVQKGEIMVVPAMSAKNTYKSGAFNHIKISYYLDGNLYNYEYTPASTTLEAGKKYIYDITFKLHEIFIDPSIEDWVDNGEFIDIPSHAVGTPWNYDQISGKASTYKFAITGLTGAAPTATVTDGSATFATDPSISSGVVTFGVSENFTNATKNYSITVTDAGDGNSGKSSVITFSQAKYAVPYIENGTATVVIPNTADTYYFNIAGITTADSYKMVEGETGTDFVTAVTPTEDTVVEAGGSLAVSVTTTSSTGNSRPIILKNDEGTTMMTIIIKQQ